MRARAGDEDGFGLVELLIAMTILNIGLFAILAAFNSGMVSLHRANRVATASTLADSQMELYRAIRFSAISLNASETSAADATYTGDSAWSSAWTVTGCSTTANECKPARSATGADGRSYRVDSYIKWDCPVGALGGSVAAPTCSPSTSRPVKLITVVVRDGDHVSKTLVRQSSTFDQSTGS